MKISELIVEIFKIIWRNIKDIGKLFKDAVIEVTTGVSMVIVGIKNFAKTIYYGVFKVIILVQETIKIIMKG